MAALRREVEALGVSVRYRTRVTGFARQGRRLAALRTAEGELAGDEFVLCAGVWSDPLARGLGLSLPLLAGKGYTLTLRRPGQRPRIPAILTEARVAVTPMGEDLRLGGTMELTGRGEAGRIAPARVQGIIDSVGRYYPELTPDAFRGVPAWSGLRPCSPDGLPYLGRFARFDNLSTASGHSMMGVSLGPVSGKLLAEVLSGERPSLDISSLSPDRYSRRSERQ
jgi:D-amino-acid dehydrogenase